VYVLPYKFNSLTKSSDKINKNKRAFVCPLRVLSTSLSTKSMKWFWLLNYFYYILNGKR